MGLRLRGVVYDVGITPFPDRPTRPHFDPAAAHREIQLIARELHCNAIRITGQDLDRLAIASECALAEGLEVWLAPIVHDAEPDELLTFLAAAARLAEDMRRRGRIIFLVGWELTFFMRDLVPGKTLDDRLRVFTQPWRLALASVTRGSFNAKLNAFLRQAVAVVRRQFHGPLSYATGTWEEVNWRPFDFVGVDFYRDVEHRDSFLDTLRTYTGYGKPVVATEFGCCTYTGARDRGSMGWAIVDRSATPARLKGNFERNEAEQATELSEMLDIFERERLSGAFAYTFANYDYPHNDDPGLDLDMASYGLVATRPDGTWRPKESYHLIARRYTGR